VNAIGDLAERMRTVAGMME